VFMKWTEKI